MVFSTHEVIEKLVTHSYEAFIIDLFSLATSKYWVLKRDMSDVTKYVQPRPGP